MSEQDPREKQFKKFQKNLPEDWRNDMMSRTADEVKKAALKAAMNLVTLELAKEFDEDLQELREALKTAQEVYTQGKKKNLIEIEFLIEVLRSRGEDVPGVEDFIKGARDVGGEESDEEHDAFKTKVGDKLKKELGKGLRKGTSITLETSEGRVTVQGESEE